MRRDPIEVAAAAERRLAEIARTRRPTEEESRQAMEAYRTARRYLSRSAPPSPDSLD